MQEEKLNNLMNKYSLSDNEKKEFLKIVNPIIEHKEFQRRLTKEFLHHSDITLGEHILEDALITYKLSKKEKKKNININLAVKIALFHDLYTIPWQNNKENTKVKKFSHKHGFRHPIEAAINASYWYKDEFKNEEEAKILIDGIIHHMYPLPVTRTKRIEEDELKNYDLFLKLPKNIQQMIKDSANRTKVFSYSLCRSKYPEGRIMSKSDKMVSFHQIKNLNSLTALLTGKNKSIEDKDKE